jgi:dolichol-phosphate mannosyltransferase
MERTYRSKNDISLSIIVPTYNESENIPILISKIYEVLERSQINGEIIVIDDNSPDGTDHIAVKLKEKYINLHVLTRKNERGLSSAVIEGFKTAHGGIYCVMDADLSHPPEIIPKLFELITSGQAELVFGSRYIQGGRIENWSFKRKLISKGAMLLAKIITSIKDPMSGFFALKQSVIDGVTLNPKGFKIGLEIIAKGNYDTIIEVPLVFRDRQYGESKLKGRVIREYLYQLLSLLFAKNSLMRRFFNLVSVFLILYNFIK